MLYSQTRCFFVSRKTPNSIKATVGGSGTSFGTGGTKPGGALAAGRKSSGEPGRTGTGPSARYEGEGIPHSGRGPTYGTLYPIRIAPGGLSITHKFCPDIEAKLDVNEARQSAPHDSIAWRSIVSTVEVSAESRDLVQIVG